MATLAGGATRLAERAAELAAAGDLRLAGHLAELAAQAAPDDAGVHKVRAEVFGQRAAEERSTMSKGVFSWAQRRERREGGDEVAAGEPARMPRIVRATHAPVVDPPVPCSAWLLVTALVIGSARPCRRVQLRRTQRS